MGNLFDQNGGSSAPVVALNLIYMRSVVYGLILGLIFPAISHAQNYHAIEGSPFAGSLGVANNPASILSTPYPWDITVFSTQVKNSTNAVVLHNWSLLSTGDTIGYKWKTGNFKRFIAFDFNIHLLNARIALDKKQAIAFGANFRGYGAVRTGRGNYSDSLQDMNQFFAINEGTVYNGSMTTSSWLELFATYSRTLIDDEAMRLGGLAAELLDILQRKIIQKLFGSHCPRFQKINGNSRVIFQKKSGIECTIFQKKSD